MVKSILTLLVATTHLLSSSAAPLYLCIGADGSVCIESQPEACDCCHTAAAGAVETCEHDHCSPGCAHDSSSLGCTASSHAEQIGTALSIGQGDPCDCRHVELTGSRGPAIVRASSAIDPGKLLASPLLAIDLPALPAVTVVASQVELFARPASTHYLSSVLRSVMLRC